MRFKRIWIWMMSCAIATFAMQQVSLAQTSQTDVVVYGATPGGITAAVAAAREGRHVLLLEPSAHIGGIVAGGLTKTDIGRRETIGGLPAEFFARVLAHYERAFGKDSEQARATKGGIFFEPHVAEQVFEEMLSEAKVTVIKNRQLTAASLGPNHLQSITVQAPDKSLQQIAGKVFIDTSYEGDLMAAAHVPYRVGREGAAEYNESLAGMNRGPHELIGKGDQRLQAYSIRSTITNRADLRLPFPKPQHYSPEAFADFLAHIHQKNIHTFQQLFPDVPEWGPVNGKSDPNKADDVDGNLNYVEADASTRRAVYEHTRDLWLTFWYMLQNDPSLSDEFKQTAREWGLPKDEFTDTGNVSSQLYVREARRMIGRYLMKQSDVQHDRTKPDGIAIGSYVIDSHPVQTILTEKGLIQEGGNIAGWTDPYSIPYRSITPVSPDNLLVPVDLSATHIAYCTIRMEPVFMELGQAAGLAASMAIDKNIGVQEISTDELRKRLSEQKVPLDPMFRPRVAIEMESPATPGTPVQFRVKALEVRSPLMQYFWNFDGSGSVQSTDASPKWTFTTGKPYTVSLTVVDSDGNSSLIARRTIGGTAEGTPDVTLHYEQAQEHGLWDKTAIAGLDERDLVAWHDLNNDKGKKSLRFETKLSRPGTYRLAIAYPKSIRRATNVPITVTTNQGTRTIHLNEKVKDTPFAFVPLADFHIASGESPSVTVGTAGTDGDVAIEAIRWLWIGE